MATAKKPSDSGHIEISRLVTQEITFNVVGDTPLICNRQSEKAKRQLLLPPLPQNKAQRTQTLKHNPLEEFRASPYLNRNDPAAPTWLHLPTGMFKKCISTAALDTPGSSKAQIGRLVSVKSATPGILGRRVMAIYVWGIPHMRADMVRQAGISKTPDVRFRACLPEWATTVTYTFVPSIISPQSIYNLLDAAGIICGIGDYRVEKGAGDYGQFHIVGEDDEDWHRIVKSGGRDVQVAAMEKPPFYDDDTRELVEWFDEEIERRRRTPAIALEEAELPESLTDGLDVFVEGEEGPESREIQ
jgi:hypothetical protein